VGLLDTSGRRSRLAGSLGSKLLARGLATGWLRQLAVLWWRKVKRVEHQPTRSQNEIATIATMMRGCKRFDAYLSGGLLSTSHCWWCWWMIWWCCWVWRLLVDRCRKSMLCGWEGKSEEVGGAIICTQRR
jgi:hypothetical protein